LRDRLGSGQTLWIPGAYDVLSARLIEEAGFDGVLVSGFGVAASLLGMPDAELYTMTENSAVVRNVTAAVSIPVMADGDNGYGNAIAVMRTVCEMEAAGASSITIEDQASPKKCPAINDDIHIIPLEEGMLKIRAAVAARRYPNLVIIARTDTRDPAEAIRRGKAFAEAGADMIKPISKGIRTIDGLRELRVACGLPLALSMLGWIETALSTRDLESLGGIVTYPLSPLFTATEALRQNLRAIKETGKSRHLPLPQTTEAEFKKFIGFEQISSLERQFLPAATV
jgi:methylisocitrate lyase